MSLYSKSVYDRYSRTRTNALNAQLEGLRDEMRAARSRGVSFSTLSAELKRAGIAVTPAALSKYLGRRARPKSAQHARSAPKQEAHDDDRDQRQVNTGEKAVHLASDTTPK
jgi:hypothetical protein